MGEPGRCATRRTYTCCSPPPPVGSEMIYLPAASDLTTTTFCAPPSIPEYEKSAYMSAPATGLPSRSMTRPRTTGLLPGGLPASVRAPPSRETASAATGERGFLGPMVRPPRCSPGATVTATGSLSPFPPSRTRRWGPGRTPSSVHLPPAATIARGAYQVSLLEKSSKWTVAPGLTRAAATVPESRVNGASGGTAGAADRPGSVSNVPVEPKPRPAANTCRRSAPGYQRIRTAPASSVRPV